METKMNKQQSKKISRRNEQGSVIAESAASLTIIVPYFVLMIMVAVEIMSFAMLKNTLNESARLAARNCAMAYHWPPYGSSQVPVGTANSPDAQGDTVAPPTTSAGEGTPSPAISGTDGSSSTSGQPRTANEAFSRIRVNGVVTANSQFKAVYKPASVNSSSSPQYQIGHVTVTVTTRGVSFPSLDPLNLRAIFPNLTVSSSATYSL